MIDSAAQAMSIAGPAWDDMQAGLSCVNCGGFIHSVLHRYKDEEPVFLWVHSDRDTMFRTQYCNWVELPDLLLP